MVLFSHVNASTGRIRIHVALSTVEREREREEERDEYLFFSPLLHLSLFFSLNKNTLNPF